MHCNSCKGDFNPPTNIVMTHCPFCHVELPVEPKKITFDVNSNEGKMQAIVTQFTPEIYKEIKRFNALIKDFFPNNEMGKLLNVIVEKNASIEVYKLKSVTGNDLKIQYNQTLDKLQTTSYIPKEISAPAVNVLCAGLGIDCRGFFTQTPTPSTPSAPSATITPTAPTTTPATPIISAKTTPTPAPTTTPNNTINTGVAINTGGFEIVNGKLIKYVGGVNDCIVKIPNSVTSIGESAFGHSSIITSVIIPNSVTEICTSAFSSCRGLKSVTIPNSVTKISGSAFWNCRSLTQITLPDSITTISYQLFGQCIDLKSVIIPNSVTSIADRAFVNCTNLDEATKARLNQLGWDESQLIPKTLTQDLDYINSLFEL